MILEERKNMPKNNRHTFISLTIILLLIMLLWLIKFKNNDSEEYNFTVTDTASVSKIFIADMTGKSISLDRMGNAWEINGKYKVQNQSMQTILKTIREISLQRPVAESAYNKVIKDLATNGVKVEIYQNHKEKPIKTYTIGGNTADHLGTYMLLENTEKPCIMHIVGFNGIMGPRYGLQGQKVNSSIWRDRSIFNLNAEQITSLTLINEKGIDSSFTIKNSEEKLILLNHQKTQLKAKQETLFSYLNQYKKINCESFKNENVKEKLVVEKKLYSLIISHQTKVDSLIIYQMRDDKSPRTKEDNYTVERMYATLNSGDVMLIQNYVFNKLLITIDELKGE